MRNETTSHTRAGEQNERAVIGVVRILVTADEAVVAPLSAADEAVVAPKDDSAVVSPEVAMAEADAPDDE